MAVQEVVRHFDRAASHYGPLRASWPLSLLRTREQAALRALANPRRGDLVLDAGCGDGETLVWLADCRSIGVGIDISFQMAAGCRQRGFTTSVQDMEHLAFGPRFDWVLCVGALEFTADPARAVASLAACLRPGGRFALLFPRRNWIGAAYALYHRSHGVRAHLFAPRSVARILLAAGLYPVADRSCGWLSSVVVAERR